MMSNLSIYIEVGELHTINYPADVEGLWFSVSTTVTFAFRRHSKIFGTILQESAPAEGPAWREDSVWSTRGERIRPDILLTVLIAFALTGGSARAAEDLYFT
jgi:hypothetical protein